MGDLTSRYLLLSQYVMLLNTAFDIFARAIAPGGDCAGSMPYFSELKIEQKKCRGRAKCKNEQVLKDLDKIWENLELMFSYAVDYQIAVEKINRILENPVINKAYNENYLQPVYNGSTYVYVMLFADDEVKIGISVEPEVRRRALENERRKPVKQMIVSKGLTWAKALKVEEEAHEHFAEKKIWGEYFNITFGDAVEYVHKLCMEEY